MPRRRWPVMGASLLMMLSLMAFLVAASNHCSHPQPCFNNAPWYQLAQQVRLEDVEPLDLRDRGPMSPRRSDPLWLADQPAGMQYSGHMASAHWSGWALVNATPAKAVRLRSAEDASRALRFATEYNLSISVKSTGHDFFGRSTQSGSLLLWTHEMTNITWHPTFTPAGCAASVNDAITVGAGVQFWQMYEEAVARQRMIMGGTGYSVGHVGCMLGGCYGDYSRMYGSGASNAIEAEVVLANGSIVTASACGQHTELFKALRGGGGAFGVVSKVTYRTHPWPKHIGTIDGEVMQLGLFDLASSVERFLSWYADIVHKGLAKHFGGQAFIVGVKNALTDQSSGIVKVQLTFVQLEEAQCNSIVAPLGRFVRCTEDMNTQIWPPKNARISQRHAKGWFSSYEHPLGFIVHARSRYFKLHDIEGAELREFASKLAKIAVRTPMQAGLVLALNYALGGGSDEALKDARLTSVHPEVFEALGSVKLLSGYWNTGFFGLDSFVPTDNNTTPTNDVRAAALESDEMVSNTLPGGAYFNEDQPHSGTQNYWGDNYEQLLRTKTAVDPLDMFNCVTCVGDVYNYESVVPAEIRDSVTGNKTSTGDISDSMFV